jgi:hypothetical protein
MNHESNTRADGLFDEPLSQTPDRRAKEIQLASPMCGQASRFKKTLNFSTISKARSDPFDHSPSSVRKDNRAPRDVRLQ